MYETWFQMSRRPFSAPPRTVNYFPNEGTEAARVGLINSIERSAGPGLVIGDHGTGKSLLSLLLLDHFRASRAVAHLAAPGVRTRKELLQTLLFEFGLPYGMADEGTLRLSLIDFLKSRDANGTVLLIDDAQDLSIELIEQLSTLSDVVRDGQWCVNLVLFGTPVLEEHLAGHAACSFNQRIAARYYLRAWSRTTTEQYIQFQLSQVAATHLRIFDAKAMYCVYECTQGIPRLINQLCEHALVLGATGEVHEISAAMIREAWSDLQQFPIDDNVIAAFSSATEDPIVEFGSLEDESRAGHPASSGAVRSSGLYETSEYRNSELSNEPRDIPSYGSAAPWENTYENPIYATSERMPSPATDLSEDCPSIQPERVLKAIERNLLEANQDLLSFVFEPSTPGVTPHAAPCPFAESFDDEELVISRTSTLRPDSLVGPAIVRTEAGARLIDVLHRLEQSLTPTSDREFHHPDHRPIRDESPLTACALSDQGFVLTAGYSTGDQLVERIELSSPTSDQVVIARADQSGMPWQNKSQSSPLIKANLASESVAKQSFPANNSTSSEQPVVTRTTEQRRYAQLFSNLTRR